AHRREPLFLRRVEAAPGDLVGRLQGPQDAAPAVDSPAVARQREVVRLFVARRNERPDAERGLRLGMTLARLVEAPVERQRLFGADPVGEKVRERVREAEVRGELSAV